MTDLFSDNRHCGGPGRATKPSTPLTLAAETMQQEIGPAFGSRDWTHCRCGRPASLYFPKAAGIRRCTACAQAEDRWNPSEPIWGRTQNIEE